MPMKLVFVLCLVVTIAIFIAICMAVDELEAKKLFKDLKQRNEEYRRARQEQRISSPQRDQARYDL